MIAKIIRWSIANRFLVLLATLMITAWGVWSLYRTPLDAIPDLSDVQVIIRTTFPGQAPQIVENQITYPLTTTMLSVPGAKVVRGYSMFGDSFAYILFEDGTDPYWARSRVLEYLNQVQSRLPAQAKASLGPDATGVGWVYEYALIDRTGKMDLSQLRALQDWFLKYELKTVPNVSEVASVGGMVRQYQIVLDPDRLRAYNIPQGKVIDAVQKANQETGGSVVELGEAEYMVRASGYLQSVDDFRRIPLAVSDAGVPITLGDVARVQVGPETRRGIAELDGEGEVAGGIIVMRSGGNALETIDAVKAKLASLESALPPGIEVVTTYDRSSLIRRAVDNLSTTLVEEFAVVALVCLVFLLHVRSAFVAIVSLPLGVAIAFIVMRHQGINATIMSLGGIAIAIGAMLDAAVVMIENAHKHIEAWQRTHHGARPDPRTRWQLIAEASVEVGPALFFSLLIITLSFVPVFTLEAQEGRLFSPLAYTKTYAMAAAAGLAVTLIPVLMGYLIRGRIPAESRNPLNRGLIAVYRPALAKVLAFPKTTLVAELDRAVKVPGLSNIWVPPIRNRIDMLATGIKSPDGVKVSGTDLREVDRVAAEVQRAVQQVPGVSSAFAERLSGGRYIDVKIDRDRAARYGLNIADVQSIVSAAIGGDNIGETVEGLQRFPINLRYPREVRDSVEKIRELPVLTDRGAQIRLGDVAAIGISDGPPMLKSENARLSSWVYIDLQGRDLSSAVREMQRAVARDVKLPPGYSISWSGQFEFLERATAKLKIVVPATLLIILVLLYLTFRRMSEALLIMATLPFALVGGFWLMFALGYNMSIASAVGFIALGGVAAEIGVVMLVYVNQAVAARSADGRAGSEQELAQGVAEGAGLGVRPIAMTVAVIVAGLLPIMFGSGTGSEVMRRIAAPMVGGMITAPLLSMFVVPAAYFLLRRSRVVRGARTGPEASNGAIQKAGS